MRVILVFPPAWSNLTAPYVGLGYLTGYLKNRGINVVQKDLNLEFAYHLLSPESLGVGYRCVKEQLMSAKDVEQELKWNTYSHIYPYVQYYLEESLAILNGQKSSSWKEYMWATHIVEIAFGISSARYYSDYFSQKDYYTSASPTISAELEASVRSNEGMFWDFFCKVVPSLLPYNFIGISVISSQQLIPGLILARMIKENNPSCHIVMGGTYITLIKGKVKNFPFIWSIIDSIVAGDGEEPLYRLICSYYRQESCDTVPNLIYKELIYKDIVNSEILSKDIVNTYISNNYIVPQENNIIKENESSFHMSVKDLEIADYHDLELKRYFSLQKVLPVVANSGCYWGKCAFCCDTYFEQKVEFREAASLLTEIKYLKARYNCRYFDLISLALGPVQIKQAAELMLENQLDVKWQCWSRLDSNWSYDIFETLYRAGCRRISFGLETASPRVLKSMNKGIDITKAVQIIKDCNRANILVKLFFMTGFPTETEAEAWETFNFIKSNLSYIDSLHHSYFTLDEPSRMAKDIDKYGITLLASPDNLNFTKHFESTIGMSRADSFRVYNEIKKQLNTLFDSVKAEWEYFFEKNGETAETIPAELRPHDFVKMGRNYLAFKLKESSVLYDIMSDKFLEIAPSVYEVLEEAKEGIKADDIYAKLGKSLVRLLLQNEVLEVI